MSERPLSDDDGEEIGPDDPDYDLSEAHGYMWEPRRESAIPPWVVVVVSLLVVAALIVPTLILIQQAD
jgi:hypothetical protein